LVVTIKGTSAGLFGIGGPTADFDKYNVINNIYLIYNINIFYNMNNSIIIYYIMYLKYIYIYIYIYIRII